MNIDFGKLFVNFSKNISKEFPENNLNPSSINFIPMMKIAIPAKIIFRFSSANKKYANVNRSSGKTTILNLEKSNIVFIIFI